MVSFRRELFIDMVVKRFVSYKITKLRSPPPSYTWNRCSTTLLVYCVLLVWLKLKFKELRLYHNNKISANSIAAKI